MTNLKPSYEELENQIVELKKQNELLSSKSDISKIENNFKFLFEKSSKGIVFCKMVYENNFPKDIIILNANLTFKNIYECENIEKIILLKSFSSFFEKFKNIYFQNFNQNVGEFSKQEIFNETLQKWFLISIINSENEYFFISFEDITNRKVIELNLQKSENRFHEIAEFLPVVVCEVDLNGKLTWANNLTYNFLGYDYSDFKNGISISDVIENHDKSKANENISNVLNGKTTNGNEYNCIKKDGTIFPVLIFSIPIYSHEKIIGMRSCLIDISQQKDIEKELKKNQDKYKSVFNSALVGIAVAKENETITFNPVMEEIFGYSKEEIYKTPFIEFFHEDDKKIIIERIKKRKLGEKLDANIQLRIFRKNGEMRYIEHNTNDFYFENEQYVQTVVIDVTDKVLSLNALKKSEEKFRILFEQAAVGVAQIETQTGKFVKINKKYSEIIGYSNDEIINLDFQTITYLSDLEDDLNYMEKLKSGDIKEFTMEKRLYHKSGNIIWVRLSVSKMWKNDEIPDYHIAVISDISQQKISEFELKKLSVAVEQSPVTIAITDTKGVIQYVNPSFCKITGYDFNEAIGQNPKVLKSGKMEDDIYINMWETITSGKTWHGEFINKKKNGEFYFEEAIISPVFDENNKIVNFIAIKNDISFKKQQEEQIKQKNNQLIELNATKDKFFSIIAHDLKNPFNSILGLSDLLATNFDKYNKEKIIHFINSINNVAQNTFKLLENLLEWSSSQTGKIEFKPQLFILETLIIDIIELTKSNSLAKNIEISYEINESIQIFADKNMINTVLRNLVTNAIKFTNKNGIIKILASYFENNILISVIDNGVGMSEDTINKLFKINEKITNIGTENESGTGLGLILCKEFIEKHKGKIWVESIKNEGSTFKFIIPKK